MEGGGWGGEVDGRFVVLMEVCFDVLELNRKRMEQRSGIGGERKKKKKNGHKKFW